MARVHKLGVVTTLLAIFLQIHQGKAQSECRHSRCVPVPNNDADLCKSKATFGEAGGWRTFEETIRDDCFDNGVDGVIALCCPTDGIEYRLTSQIGVEPHEFPHFARLEKPGEHGQRDICGGTVYNERHVITASHCVVDKEAKAAYAVDQFTVYLDMTISGKPTNKQYSVEKVFIHPNASLIQKRPGHLNHDVAILKLSQDIQFSDRIKALPLAPVDFEPTDYADTAVIVGFGDTDTMKPSRKLQKADSYIRDGTENTQHGSRFPQHKAHVDQLIFLGGYQHGIQSPSASGGDSGGPAVCRDENGEAVLCGLTSFGPMNKEKCEEYKSEEECFPTAYAKVDYFRKWIEESAGKQKEAQVLRQPLYGKDVSPDNHPSQVEISLGRNTVCGGTLIAKDVVLTAAHCVAEGDGTMKVGLTVKQGKGSKGVKSVTVLDGFKRAESGRRNRRLAVFGTTATWMDPYYQNDLALVKLKGSFKVSSLPRLAEAGATPGAATEVAWMTESRRRGNLAEREFNLLSQAECQKRVGRFTQEGLNFQVDDNIVCGVEKYSGGSKCDMTLGGGVFCDGGNTLCGVQVFRLCQFSYPNAFVDVGLQHDWIEENMKDL